MDDHEPPPREPAVTPAPVEAVEPDPGYVAPDPDEPPPVELWRAVGDVPPWGTAVLLLAWAAVFTTFAVRREFGDTGAYLAWGADTSGANAFETAWRMLAATLSAIRRSGTVRCRKRSNCPTAEH